MLFGLVRALERTDFSVPELSPTNSAAISTGGPDVSKKSQLRTATHNRVLLK